MTALSPFFRHSLLALALSGTALAGAPSTQTFSDPLLPDANRAVGSQLKDTPLAEGSVKWSAKGITFKENGVTTTTPNGAHHMINPVAGTIRVEADVNPKGSGFTSIAVGRGDLSGNFWANVSMNFYVYRSGGFNLMINSKNLISKPDKSLIKPEESNHLELLIDTIGRTMTAKVNGTVVLDAMKVPEALNLSRINALGFRFNEPITPSSPSVSNYRAEVVSKATSGLELVDLGMAFVEPDKEATLAWKVTSPGPSSEIAYVIKDYADKEVDKGSTTIKDGQLSIARKFPRGYFDISFPESGQSFGVVSLEPHAGPTDEFFGLDAGLSWLEKDAARRVALVKIMARSGISIVRERLGTGSVNTAKGKYNWEGSGQFNTIRKEYARNNIKLLEIMDAGGGEHIGKPKNYSEVAAAITDIAKHWTLWGGVEASNEPDLLPDPASQYVPLVKSMSYALEQAGSNIPVVAGALATMPPGPYFDTCYANGMLDDCNALSFHSYDKAPDVEAMIVRYRTWLKQCGKESLPLWHTECGWAWKQGPDRPPQDQDASSAMHITAKAIESLVCGVSHHFPFVLAYYEEGAKNFGLFGREATPLRSMAAYSTCITSLSGKKYVGDVDGLDATVKLARVFETKDPAEYLAVLYTGESNSAAKLTTPFKIKRAAGADGRTLDTADGKVPMSDGIAYVWIDRAELGSKLKKDTGAMALYQLGQDALEVKRRASPILLTFLSEDTRSRASSRRYLLSPEVAGDLPIKVRIYNMSQNNIALTPAITLPGKSPQNYERLTIPAMGFSDVNWKLDASQALDIAQTRFITITANAENTTQPTALALPMVMEGDLNQHLTRHPKQTRLPVTDLARWKQNLSGGTCNFSLEENKLHMEVKFPDRATSWTYPNFILPADVDVNAHTGVLFRARIEKEAKNVAIIAKSKEGAPSFWVSDLFPADGAWHVVYVPFAEFKPGPGGPGNQNTRLAPQLWEALQIGFGGCHENTMEISHLMLVGGSGD